MAASGSARKRLVLSRSTSRKTPHLLVSSGRRLEKKRALPRSDSAMTGSNSVVAPSAAFIPPGRASGKKIDKRRAKHTAWRKQLEAAKEQRLDRLKEAQKRRVGSPFAADALSASLQTLSTSTPQQAAEKTPFKQSRKASGNPQKNRARLLLQEAQQFGRVLGHPQFKADPVGAIRQHVVNKIQQELSQ